MQCESTSKVNRPDEHESDHNHRRKMCTETGERDRDGRARPCELVHGVSVVVGWLRMESSDQRQYIRGESTVASAMVMLP